MVVLVLQRFYEVDLLNKLRYLLRWMMDSGGPGMEGGEEGKVREGAFSCLGRGESGQQQQQHTSPLSRYNSCVCEMVVHSCELVFF